MEDFLTSKKEKQTDEPFYIMARRCKRCGGILTSTDGVRDGYGHVCKKKEQAEQAARNLKGQVSVFDLLGIRTDDERRKE